MKETHLHPSLHATVASPAHKSARLGVAEARLGSALDGLERALGSIAAARGGDSADTAVRGAEQVSRLQDENAALQQTHEQIAGRLDAAVDRLRRVLAD